MPALQGDSDTFWLLERIGNDTSVEMRHGVHVSKQERVPMCRSQLFLGGLCFTSASQS